MESKATVASFCLELSKKLEIRFQCLPLPVDLALVNRSENIPNNASPNSKSDNSAALLAALRDKNK
jgi:hypothetical protein